MTRALLPPMSPKDPVSERRLDVLETRSLTRAAIDMEDTTRIFEAIFYNAEPTAGDTSGRWYPPRDATLFEVIASLDTAGSSDTDVDVLIDGGVADTLTLGSGVNSVVLGFADLLARNVDWITVEVPVLGTGAGKLTVQGRLSW